MLFFSLCFRHVLLVFLLVFLLVLFDLVTDGFLNLLSLIRTASSAPLGSKDKQLNHPCPRCLGLRYPKLFFACWHAYRVSVSWRLGGHGSCVFSSCCFQLFSCCPHRWWLLTWTLGGRADLQLQYGTSTFWHSCEGVSIERAANLHTEIGRLRLLLWRHTCVDTGPANCCCLACVVLLAIWYYDTGQVSWGLSQLLWLRTLPTKQRCLKTLAIHTRVFWQW